MRKTSKICYPQIVDQSKKQQKSSLNSEWRNLCLARTKFSGNQVVVVVIVVIVVWWLLFIVALSPPPLALSPIWLAPYKILCFPSQQPRTQKKQSIIADWNRAFSWRWYLEDTLLPSVLGQFLDLEGGHITAGYQHRHALTWLLLVLTFYFKIKKEKKSQS
jgi:hypothetical protein